MAKTVFLLNSGHRKMKGQIKRLRRFLADSALKLHGPFSDNNGSVSRLVHEIKKRPLYISDPRKATMLALGPQNQPLSKKSWLKTPFILGENPEGLDCSSVEEMADCGHIRQHGHKVRRLDLDSLTMLTVAVLRRFQVPALFSYRHINQDLLLPSITIMNGSKVNIMAFYPQELRRLRPDSLMKGVEVLSDDALEALMTIKNAHSRMEQLMRDMARRRPFFNGEGTRMAISIGHQFYEGMVSWPLHKAEKSLKDAEDMAKTGKSGLMSVRRLAESLYVYDLFHPIHHALLASENTSALDRKLVFSVANAITHEDFDLLKTLNEMFENKALKRLSDYMELSRKIREHLHPAGGCSCFDSSSSN